MMRLLTAESLSVGYEGKSVAKNISFTVNSGDYLSVVGENGAGKSTLMKTILSLKAPLSGKLEIEKSLLKGRIGYLPQQTEVQKGFPATAFEIVLSGFVSKRGFCPFYSKVQKQQALAWLSRLEIEALKNKSYKALSGGQQQRVLLARALCAAERLILLDEPTAGLDPFVTKSMYSLISSLNKENEMSVIMISHDLDAALKYSTHILQITHAGCFFGTVEEYRKSAHFASFSGKGDESNA